MGIHASNCCITMPGVVRGVGATTRLIGGLEVSTLPKSEDGAPIARGKSVKIELESVKRIVATVIVGLGSRVSENDGLEGAARFCFLCCG